MHMNGKILMCFLFLSFLIVVNLFWAIDGVVPYKKIHWPFIEIINNRSNIAAFSFMFSQYNIQKIHIPNLKGEKFYPEKKVPYIYSTCIYLCGAQICPYIHEQAKQF